MDILKRLAIRIFDACIIAMLIYGDGNMRAFGSVRCRADDCCRLAIILRHQA